MSKKLIYLFLLSLGFVGCATVPKADLKTAQQIASLKQPQEGQAGIYVYRNHSIKGNTLKKDIWIDGQCLGQTAAGIYFYKEVEGGKNHIISTESEFSPNHLTLATESGKQYFIQQKIKMGAFVGGAKLEQTDEVKARADIRKIDLGTTGQCSKQSIELPSH